jgi:GT2 family glycosyltransferase
VEPEAALSVSIVVPAHRADANLAECLRAISAMRPSPLERILAMDGPGEGLEAAAAAAGFRAQGCAVPSGPAAARNAGARGARGDVLLFLDSDVVAPSDLLATLDDVFREHPQAAAVIGSYDATPREPSLVSRYRNLLHHHVHQTAHETAFSFWAGCGAIRRTEFERLGGFDDSYTAPSVEDIELGYRLRARGGEIRLAKRLQVTHLKRWTIASFLWTDMARRALPWTRLILRGGRVANDLNLSGRHRASLVASLGFALGLILLPLGSTLCWLAVASAAAFLFLNRAFFALLFQQGGTPLVLAGIPLHLLHYLAGGLGLAAGIAGWPARRIRSISNGARTSGGSFQPPRQ